MAIPYFLTLFGLALAIGLFVASSYVSYLGLVRPTNTLGKIFLASALFGVSMIVMTIALSCGMVWNAIIALHVP